MGEINEQSNDGIDLVKYIAAILIICFHCERVIQDPVTHHLFKNVLCRVAVPYFLLAGSYFFRKGQSSSKGYMKRYLRSSVQVYLFWSLIYLPLGFSWLQENYALSSELYPIALLVGLAYTGTYYHLWYIPAMLFGIVSVRWLVEKVGYIPLFCGAIVLYLFGSLETYYSYIHYAPLKAFVDGYMTVFMTTRNGLLFGFIFVLLGYFLWDYQMEIAKYREYLPLLLFLSGVVLVSEGLVVFVNIGIDKNFMLGLIPFTSLLFYWSLQRKVKWGVDFKRLRNLGKYYFFVHPLCIVWTASLVNQYQFLANSWLQLLVTFVATHFISSAIIAVMNVLPYVYFDLQLLLRINKFHVQLR